MGSTRKALAVLCAAALVACDGADSLTGPTANPSLIPIETDFLPGIPVLDPFAPSEETGVVESARGSGHFHIGSALRTFAFTAKNKADGTTQGQYQVNNRDAAGSREHGIVTCLEVDEDEAWVGGVITASSVPGREGVHRVWRVVDRGEGSGALPDQVSFLLVVPSAETCHIRPDLLPEDIESGNIQVQDAR